MRFRAVWYSVATLLGAVFFPPRQASCLENRRELERRLNALYKSVDFMARRPDQLNVDAIFGLTLVQAHLRQTLEHENVKLFEQYLQDMILEVYELVELTRLCAISTIERKTTDNSALNRVLNQPDVWLGPIQWTLGVLGPRPSPSEGNSEAVVQSFFFKGTPNETNSDRCIFELAEDSTKPSCRVSDYCVDVILKNDDSRGYPLTHRLLYILIASALRCTSPGFESLIPKYCEAILQDAVDMEDANFPAVSRDMICEQIVLCGMNGFLEFANDHYARLILKWQHPTGCYSAIGFGRKSGRRRSRRASDPMDFGCDNHATALGAVSLSLLIRSFVETLTMNA